MTEETKDLEHFDLTKTEVFEYEEYEFKLFGLITLFRIIKTKLND